MRICAFLLFSAASRVLGVAVLAPGLALPACAITVRPPTFPQLAGRAAFVAETTVESLRAEMVHRGADRAIVTYVTFTTRSAITGAVPGEFTLEFLAAPSARSPWLHRNGLGRRQRRR